MINIKIYLQIIKVKLNMFSLTNHYLHKLFNTNTYILNDKILIMIFLIIMFY